MSLIHKYPGEAFKHWNEFVPGPVQQLKVSNSIPSLNLVRLDLLRSWATGNKYYKLKYALKDALSQGVSVIVSKGGMFSNHIAALSEACYSFNIQLIAVLRSFAPDEMNPCIQNLRKNKNEVLYLHPSAYKAFDEAEAERLFPGALFIPEGGLNLAGIRGTGEIIEQNIHHHPSHIVLPGGTMGTACGILSSAPAAARVVVVPAWKGCTYGYVNEILDKYGITPACTWELWTDYHFGGFGKFDRRLIDFMSSFYNQTGIPLDPVYTGKMMYAIEDKLNSGFFSAADSVMAIHTGGLQGVEGFRYRYPEAWGSYLL